MRIPYALRGDELVDPHEYDTGGRKFGIVCPGCKEPLVAKIGEVREPHFAHLPDKGAKCQFRTVLHRVAVRLLARRLGELLRTRAGLLVRWKCPICGQYHTANLLDGIQTTATARQIGSLRPDLTLFADEGQSQTPRAVIHLGGKPANADKLAAFRALNIPVWLFKRPEQLAEAEAMKAAVELSAVEALGMVCPQPKSAIPAVTPSSSVRPPLTVAPADPVYPDGCPGCGKNLKRRFLYVEWKYPERRTTEDIAIVMLGKDGATSGPRTFTARELAAAREHCADVTDRGRSFYEHSAEILKHSQPVGSFAQGCSHCGRVVPDQEAATEDQ